MPSLSRYLKGLDLESVSNDPAALGKIYLTLSVDYGYEFDTGYDLATPEGRDEFVAYLEGLIAALEDDNVSEASDASGESDAESEDFDERMNQYLIGIMGDFTKGKARKVAMYIEDNFHHDFGMDLKKAKLEVLYDEITRMIEKAADAEDDNPGASLPSNDELKRLDVDRVSVEEIRRLDRDQALSARIFLLEKGKWKGPSESAPLSELIKALVEYKKGGRLQAGEMAPPAPPRKDDKLRLGEMLSAPRPSKEGWLQAGEMLSAPRPSKEGWLQAGEMLPVPPRKDDKLRLGEMPPVPRPSKEGWLQAGEMLPVPPRKDDKLRLGEQSAPLRREGGKMIPCGVDANGNLIGCDDGQYCNLDTKQCVSSSGEGDEIKVNGNTLFGSKGAVAEVVKRLQAQADKMGVPLNIQYTRGSPPEEKVILGEMTFPVLKRMAKAKGLDVTGKDREGVIEMIVASELPPRPAPRPVSPAARPPSRPSSPVHPQFSKADLEAMTVVNLKKLAKERDIAIPSKALKAEVVTTIHKALKKKPVSRPSSPVRPPSPVARPISRPSSPVRPPSPRGKIRETYTVKYWLIDEGEEVDKKPTAAKLKEWFNDAVAPEQIGDFFAGVKIVEMTWTGIKLTVTLEASNADNLNMAINHIADPDDDGNYPYEGEMLVMGEYKKVGASRPPSSPSSPVRPQFSKADLEAMTVVNLKKMAKERDIALPSKALKAEVVTTILKALKKKPVSRPSSRPSSPVRPPSPIARPVSRPPSPVRPPSPRPASPARPQFSKADLEAMTVVNLKKLAKERDIALPGKALKADVVKTILKALKKKPVSRPSSPVRPPSPRPPSPVQYASTSPVMPPPRPSQGNDTTRAEAVKAELNAMKLPELKEMAKKRKIQITKLKKAEIIEALFNAGAGGKEIDVDIPDEEDKVQEVEPERKSFAPPSRPVPSRPVPSRPKPTLSVVPEEKSGGPSRDVPSRPPPPSNVRPVGTGRVDVQEVADKARQAIAKCAGLVAV